MRILQGDMRERLAELADNSVDSCVTDPPYHLQSIHKRFSKSPRSEATENTDNPYGRTGRGFMGQTWDGGDVAFQPDTWRAVLRVLKPGAHLVAFGGSRTYHRMACAVEDAGFELRDQIMWLYGSGFPKSHNLDGEWEGWGTALKPAHEPIVLARKPLVGTVAANVTAYGTGALNIDECRVDGGKDVPASPRRAQQGAAYGDLSKDPGTGSGWDPNVGRWPANVIHDGSDEVLAAFPNAPGQMADASSSSETRKTQNVYGVMRRGRGDEPSADSGNEGSVGFKMKPGARRLDSGSAARFFYCAKASKKDRDEGCDGLPKSIAGMVSETSGQHITRRDPGYQPKPVANNHPTVKPTDLMRYLCRLVTPPGGVVLDPFMGSGSTGKAARLEGFDFVGIELSEKYIEIARRRIGFPEWLE